MRNDYSTRWQLMSNESAARALASHACEQAGLSFNGAETVRLGENALFRLPDGIIVRVSRPDHQAAAYKEVAVSRWLNEVGIAAVMARQGITQPIIIANQSITFWDELNGIREGTPQQIAGALKRLHALPIPTTMPLAPITPFIRLNERIVAATTLSADDRTWLKGRLAQLEEQWNVVEPELPACVVHGDAWSGNVVQVEDGRVVLLDLERCAIGPYQWDLVSTAFKHVTSGLIDEAQYRQFCDTYGCDVTTWSGFTLLRDIRELRVTCYIAQRATENSRNVRQAQYRVDCLRGKCGLRPWAWTPAE
jgi:thiamine kinase-like enzyme